MVTSPAPVDLEEVLAPAWLDAALRTRYPGVRVASVGVVETLTTIATKVRVRVDYEDPGVGPAPDALCVKGYFGPESRSFASLGQVEARFYGEVAPRLDVRVPPCEYVGIDTETGHGLVLMRDLVAQGCRFLTALDPYTVDQAAATLEQLARLHATGRASAARDAAWLAPRLVGFLDYVTEARLQAQLDDGRAVTLSPGVRDAARLRAGFGVLAARAGATPAVLIHGDAHAGNLYLTADGDPGLIDWQVVQWGPWALDVAYHVGAVLTVADRERHERALLSHYLDAVAIHGGEPPPPGAAWDVYRDAFVYGYFMWAITQRVERPVVEEFVHRLGSAVEAHDSLARLGV